MVQRHLIPHLKPLIVESKNPEGQGVATSGVSRHLLLKSEFFTKSWRGRPKIMPRPQSYGSKMPTIRAFK